jgi:hypothetical protein
MSDIEPVSDLPTDVASDVSNGCFGSLIILVGLISILSVGFYLVKTLLLLT